MPLFTELYLRWDGLCAGEEGVQAIAEEDRCNSHYPGPPAGPPPAQDPALLPHHHEAAQGAVLGLQRAWVCIRDVGDVFAPIEEHTPIHIKVQNLHAAKWIVLQVRDKDGQLVYAEALDRDKIALVPRAPHVATPRLAADADDPAAENNADRRKDRRDRGWANPTESPYRVHVLLSHADEQPALDTNPDPLPELGADLVKNSVFTPTGGADPPVKRDETTVQYHSLELSLMPWERVYEGVHGDPPPEDGDPWVQYKLNTIGCFAGRIGEDLGADGDLAKAKRRYAVMRGLPDGEGNRYRYFRLAGGACQRSDAAPPDVTDRLAAEDPRSPLDPADGFADPGRSLKLYVDVARFYANTGEEFEDPAPDGGDPVTAKSTAESAWLSRPRLPVQARVLVRDAGGIGRWVPEAVGPAPVEWRWNDTEEALGGLLEGAPNYTHNYVDRAKVSTNGAQYSDRYHNSRQVVGGLIEGGDADAGVVFEQLATMEHVAIPAGALLAGVRVDACTVANNALLGSSCVYLSTSTIGGDNYQVEARVPDLETKTSARVTVWRRVPVSAIVTWPVRGDDVSLRQVGTIEQGVADANALLAPAYTVLDIPAADPIGIAALAGAGLRDAFNGAVGGMIQAAGGADFSNHLDSAWAFSPEAFLGSTFAGGAAGERVLRQHLMSVVPTAGEVLSGPVHDAVAGVKGDQYRFGLVLMDMKTYNYTDPNQIGASMAGPGGLVFISRHCPFPLGALIAHEVAHAQFIQHWLNAAGVCRHDHDQSNTNCVMSYPLFDFRGLAAANVGTAIAGTSAWPAPGPEGMARLPYLEQKRDQYSTAHKDEGQGEIGAFLEHLHPNVFNPVFCGKCLLKLRGWNIRGTIGEAEDALGVLPLQSAGAGPAVPGGCDNPFSDCPVHGPPVQNRVERDRLDVLGAPEDQRSRIALQRALSAAAELSGSLPCETCGSKEAPALSLYSYVAQAHSLPPVQSGLQVLDTAIRRRAQETPSRDNAVLRSRSAGQRFGRRVGEGARASGYAERWSGALWDQLHPGQ